MLSDIRSKDYEKLSIELNIKADNRRDCHKPVTWHKIDSRIK